MAENIHILTFFSNQKGFFKVLTTILSMNENSKKPELKGKMGFQLQLRKFIQDTYYFNSIILLVVGLQYLLIPMWNGVMFIEQGFFIYLFLLFGLISFLVGLNYKKKGTARFGIFWTLINFALSFGLSVYFSGTLTIWLTLLTIILTIVSGTAFFLNIFYLITKRKKNARPGDWEKNQLKSWSTRKKAMVAIMFLLVIGMGIGTFNSFGKTYTVKADDDFKTISSYWGPPRDDRTHVSRDLNLAYIANNSSINLQNSTLNESVDNFGIDSFCYANFIYVNGDNSTNYCNYTDGAMSYPNGTIILSQNFNNATTDNITISFVYRYDIQVFADLGATNATLIMNYLNNHDDFIKYSNIFMRIQRTYLFQLLDWWGVKYYLDCGVREVSFPHVFNYPPCVELGYEAIDWAAQATVGESGPKALTHMVGISYDFESSNKVQYEYNQLQNWDLAPWFANQTNPPYSYNSTNATSLLTYSEWIGTNEQNRTLYAEAVKAYEDLSTYCSSEGYQVYAVFQGNAMMDTMDGDLDSTRLPTYPISPNKDVIYGIMCYQDSKNFTGDYLVYRDCVNQIELYGDQGDTILLGWLSIGANFYAPNAQGKANYIQHCKVAQAAGIKEIFHAPLYRMQGMWGNDAIMELHEALNEDPKETIVIEAPSWKYNSDLMLDYIQNFNRLSLFIPMVLFMLWKVVLERTKVGEKLKTNVLQIVKAKQT